MKDPITFADVLSARKTIADHVIHTPLRPSASLTDRVGSPVWLKCEQQQYTGSFKLRGAANAVLRLSDEDKAKGVVGVSTGNYGRALAYAARNAGVRSIICMSELVPRNKIDGIRAQGAEVRIIGQSQDAAQHEVDRLVKEEGMIMLPPFDHADVIAGPAKPPEIGLRNGDPIAFRRGKAGAANHGKASRLYIDILNRKRHPVLQNKPHACAARFSRQFRPANRRDIDGGVGKIKTEFNLEVAQRASRDQHDIAAQAAFHVEACCRRHEGGKPLGLGRVGAKHQPVLQTVFCDHKINR